MKRKWVVMCFFPLLGYILLYGALKAYCNYPKYGPVNPWEGEHPRFSEINVRIWGDWIDHFFDENWQDTEIKMNYREPNFLLPTPTKRLFNWIYLPLQKSDELATGWAVRFRIKKRARDLNWTDKASHSSPDRSESK